MDFDVTDTQQMLIDSANRLVTDRCGLEQWHARRALPDGVDSALWDMMAELGWFALAVPEEAGGLGGSMEDVALLMIELGKGLVVEPIVSTGILAVHVIDRAAPAEARDQWLGAIAAGERRVALAQAEAADPYNFTTAQQTTAHRAAGGFTLSGSKILALDAPSAATLLITAAIAGEPGFGIFLVPSDSEGLTQSPYPLLDGSRAADITMHDVRLPKEALLASGMAAVALLAEALDRARLALLAQAVGSIEASVQLTAAYATERKQFGQSIGKFQAIAHLAADMFVASYQARSALYHALGETEGQARRRAISSAKVIISEAGQIVSRNGIQIHGGYGMTDEYPISHHYRRLLSLEKQYGSADWHLGQLAAT